MRTDAELIMPASCQQPGGWETGAWPSCNKQKHLVVSNISHEKPCTQSETGVGLRVGYFSFIVCTRTLFVNELAAVKWQQRRWWQSTRIKGVFSRKHAHTRSGELWLTGNGRRGSPNPSKLRPQRLWIGKTRSLWHVMRQICLAVRAAVPHDTGCKMGRNYWNPVAPQSLAVVALMWLVLWVNG